MEEPRDPECSWRRLLQLHQEEVKEAVYDVAMLLCEVDARGVITRREYEAVSATLRHGGSYEAMGRLCDVVMGKDDAASRAFWEILNSERVKGTCTKLRAVCRRVMATSP